MTGYWVRSLAASLALLSISVSGALACGSPEAVQTLAATDELIASAHPKVECSAGNGCNMRIVARMNGCDLVSDPMPYAPASETVKVVFDPEPTHFALPEGHPIMGWRTGEETTSVEVAIELIDVQGNPGLIAHLLAGFDHLKRAHAVLEAVDGELRTHRVFRESPGPDFLGVWAEGDRIKLSQKFNNGPVHVETYEWTGSGRDRRLVRVKTGH